MCVQAALQLDAQQQQTSFTRATRTKNTESSVSRRFVRSMSPVCASFRERWLPPIPENG